VSRMAPPMNPWIVGLACSFGLVSAALAAEHQGGLTMILLERDGCLGECPVYAVRVTMDRAVQFDGKSWVRDFGKREGTVSRDAFQRLVHAVGGAHFDNVSTEFLGRDACEEWATDAPTMWITVMRNAKLKRVGYDFGCTSDKFKGDIARIIQLGQTIDEIAGTSKWIGPERDRRASRCVHYEPSIESLAGSVIYRTFTDATGQVEHCALLLLDSPICSEGHGAYDPPSEVDQILIQLNTDLEKFAGGQSLAGRHVTVSGSLYHGHTAHHHVALQLDVHELKVQADHEADLHH